MVRIYSIFHICWRRKVHSVEHTNTNDQTFKNVKLFYSLTCHETPLIMSSLITSGVELGGITFDTKFWTYCSTVD